MNRLPLILLAVVLLLAPIVAALPDGSALTQTLWASGLCALVMLAVIVMAWSGRPDNLTGIGYPRLSFMAAASFFVLLLLALLSIPTRLLMHHSTAYLGLMLRGGTVLATEFALFVLCRSLARVNRAAIYALVSAAIVGAAILATNGVTEYALHAVSGDRSWRVFSWSTPDFLAGYLVLILPVTLALFLGAPFEKRLPLLFGLFIIMLMATLLTSGSRFALVSLLAAVIVFAATLAYAGRHGWILEASIRRRIIGIAIVVALAGLAAAGPILNRLHNTAEGNSGAFRLWTWKGAARMAAANPILGTGVGAWVDTYPPYALVGFTRLAHNSYLQVADECGIPAAVVLLVTLGFVSMAGWRGLKSPLAETASAASAAPPPALPRKKGRKPAPHATAPDTDLLSAIAPVDDRLLLCGLLASLAAVIVQSLIDSDWHVFFIGVTFWALAGLAVGLAERGENSGVPKAASRRPIITGIVATIFLLLAATEAVAAWFGYQAQTALTSEQADYSLAQTNYSLAQTWDPLDGRYPAELGARVYGRTGDYASGETSLRLATRLEPNGINYNRLGTLLDKDNKHDEAAEAYRTGLQFDPNSLDLLLALAKDSPPDQALAHYRRVAALEDSPVGRVRAIGEINEVKFAIADAAIASAAGATGNHAEAVQYNRRAQSVIEEYADEGGTTNTERQVQMGNHPDPDEDTQFRDLYAQVMRSLIAVSPVGEKASLQERSQRHQTWLQAVIDAGQGDTAPTPPEAAAAYERAATVLEGYASATPTADALADQRGNAQMRGLYQRVLDSLRSLTPAGQQRTIKSREQKGLQNFARLFPVD